ncbi:UDP-glucosyltransferase 2-like [Eupeodes corollae]|uniref:UDP-glucosyltransferase 2-like n=1 Tax=Eupeodes corollae TaxID=290404 RepID=UPI0024924557|nr:UDP-glucosyltransferase 2-like [Eupeodes corollae]
MSSSYSSILTIACVLLTSHFNITYSARILGVVITPCKSHLIVHTAILSALAERGHNITVLTTIPLVTENTHFRHIQLETRNVRPGFYTKLINERPPWYVKMYENIQEATNYSNYSFNTPKMKKLMDEESFDLIIFGYLFNEFLLGLQAHFQCPVIISLPVRPLGSINGLVGNPPEVSYVPSLLSGDKQPLGFVERVRNFMYINILEELMLTYFYQWYQSDVYKSIFPPDKYPSLDEVKKNVSLILTNHHFSQTPIRPNVPAMVEIGGIQIKEKPNPLPEDIKSILDSSTKHGVVYFSLGTNVQGSFLNSSKVKIIFDVLSKLPQTVLWKWSDSEVPPGISPNIFYKSWLPQDDILAHKNVKLFVTHGGQGSVVESQHHGVPMVGIPLFSDQSSNMENVAKQGFGLSVDYQFLTEIDFNNAVQEVLSNKIYTENVRRFAEIYKDRPMTAKDTAVFWVEYVLRHHGAPHMQSPAVYLNNFQLLSLDVIGFLLAVVYISFRIIKVMFSLILGLFWEKKKVKNV